MTRLTQAKVDRWRSDVAKAYNLLDKVRREAREYRISAKGGRLSWLTDLAGETSEGMKAVVKVMAPLDRLADHESHARSLRQKD